MTSLRQSQNHQKPVNGISELSSVIDGIKTISAKILKKSIERYAEIENQECELVKGLIKKYKKTLVNQISGSTVIMGNREDDDEYIEIDDSDKHTGIFTGEYSNTNIQPESIREDTHTLTIVPSKEEAVYILEKTVDDIIKDAETVADEIFDFEKNIIKGRKKLMANRLTYPFLASVYFGDLYDVSGIEALIYLRDELQKTIKSLKEKNILNNAIRCGISYYD